MKITQIRHHNPKLILATYQSIYKLPKEWFAQFGVVVGDEAHLFAATTLVALMNKMTSTPYRFGFTGTLDESVSRERKLEGVFGPIFTAARTTELISDGYLAKFVVRCVLLRHGAAARESLADCSYDDEIQYLIASERRNRYIRNLVSALRGNTLLLFERVEKHGKVLEAMIRELVGDSRPVYFVHGGVDTEVREEYRHRVEGDEDAIYVASYGTTSTGINIPKLHNIVFAHPSKGRIRNLQSIGRVLRLHETKDVATLYDVSDDLSVGGEMNYTLRHFVQRVKTYNSEGFDYRVYPVELGED